MHSARKQTLLEAAASEAKRFGHPTPGPAHLALAIARMVPGALDAALGAGAPDRLVAALRRRGPQAPVDLASLIDSSVADRPEELLAALVPHLAALIDPAPRRSEEWRVGDVVLGLYELLGILGEGGMGRVYRARHRSWGMDLAIKCARPELLADERNRAAFEHEAQLWIELGLHPQICACHYVRHIGEVAMVVAEFVEGGSLADWVRSGRLYAGGPRVALSRILELAIGFAHGLAYAHGRGLVHQDVKPANVLLTADGMAKVADFGLARAAAVSAGLSRRTADEPVVDPRVSLAGMTPAYRSPEQAGAAIDGRALSPATDVWSFAVSLLELFMAGLPGPDGQAAGHVLGAFVARGGRVRETQIPAMPDELADLLGRCLAREPGDRPTMPAVTAELVDIHAHATGAAYPPLPRRQLRLLAGELSNRALSALDLGRPDEAERLWVAALEEDPLHPQAVYNQGLWLWRQARMKDDELAMRLHGLRAAHRSDWVDEYVLALVHLERGDLTGAAALLAEAQADAGERPELAAAREALRTAGHGVRCLHELDAHPVQVNAVALGAEGRIAVSGSDDATARVWDLASARCVGSLEGHRGYVRAVALTADGSRALTASADATARLWDVGAGQCLQVLRGHVGRLASVAIAADGQWGLTGGDDATARLWDLRSGRCVRTLAGQLVALTADARRAVTSQDDGTVKVWEAVSGRCLRMLDGHPEGILSVSLTSDGRLALTAGKDGAARLWELDSGRCLRTLECFGAWTLAAIAGDGRVAVTSAFDKCLRIWELASGRCLYTHKADHDIALSVAVTRDARLAFAGSTSGKVRLWQLGDPGRLRSPFAYTRPRPARDAAAAEASVREALAEAARLARVDPATAMQRLRSARRIPGYERHSTALAESRTVRRHGRRVRPLSAWPVRTLRGHWALGLDPEASIALTGSEDGAAKVWDLSSGRCYRTLDTRSDKVIAVALDETGEVALTSSRDPTLLRWFVQDAERLRLEGHSARVGAVALTPDGRVALTGSDDRTAGLWDADDGRRLHTLRGHTEPVAAVALTPDGALGLTGSDDDTAIVWDLASGRRIHTLRGHTADIASVALRADGRIALTAGSDGTVRLWDLDAGCCVQTLAAPGNRRVGLVALSYDWRFALTGHGDGVARLWELEGGACVLTLECHTTQIFAGALDREAHHALTCSIDGTVLLWELDWEYEFPQPADWDERARPFLESFLRTHVPYAEPLAPGGVVRRRPLRRGSPAWTEPEFDELARRLGQLGFGWLRKEALRAELEVMAAAR